MKSAELAARRRHFEHRIVQERIELLAATREWRAATAPIDQGWHQLMRYKGPLLLGAGTAVTVISRRPGRMGRLLKRGVVLYTLVRRARVFMRR